MNLLLDTCVVLWWLDDDPTLSQPARNAIADGRNLVFVSAAAIWEIRIKAALGKLIMPPHFREVLETQPFVFLDITSDPLTLLTHSDDSVPPQLVPPDHDQARASIIRALESTRGNRRRAARRRGMPYSTLLYKMQKLGIG